MPPKAACAEHGLPHNAVVLRAAVDNLERALREQLPVAPGELRIIYRLGLLGVGEDGRAQILAGAHELDEPPHGVGLAVILRRADFLGELVLLAVHVVGQQQAAARVRRAEQLAEERGRVRQLAAPAGEVSPLGEGGVEAQRPHLADAQRDGHGRRAVQLLEPARDARHVRIAHGAAAQHRGYERIHIRVPALELREQHGAHRARLEALRPQCAQEHARHYLLAPEIHSFASRRFIPVL